MSGLTREIYLDGYASGEKRGEEKGKEKGKEEGKIESFLSLVKKGLLELSVAAKELGMSEKQFKKLINS